ncbi:unnamed protein product (macronuclear) [Paramecium tetraurelia]|uniref:non-specific serine/threonine protein kinase n=1 Tax=Paramecium tetraurelia TaxID=5888 RepID=A0ED21_PARTE|nr:uncharacterized protein GSPATT00004057001 [Paramecium tetraurelia]CAK93188.1 unnamed protein product [Paramecium tetraurelia]|eukprot:XP_001460585.1 hypothetical protein (macronuclear) [Paramecium tetraurelia strain d4-2]
MDKYKKIRVVGKGSFGYALLAQALSNKKNYIIKIIDISKMDRKQREEALNEVHVLKAMRHPYIITYRESFMEKKCLCIVMDYADGGDLYGKIAKQKELGILFSEEQILDWFVQMALAMNHIHERKILHRDLKTQNIFLTSKNDVKIGDFGIARVLQHTYDCAKTAIGTPYYLSPEICQEKPYNQKSDIWSLGCILYELTTLNHAFDALSMKELVLKILRGTYPPIPSQYSSELQSLIADMLIKDPSKRPSIKRILERDFLKQRIGSLLVSTLNRHELQELTEIKPTENLFIQPQQTAQQFILQQKQFEQNKISQNQSQNNSPITSRQIIQTVASKKPSPKKDNSKVELKSLFNRQNSPLQSINQNYSIQQQQIYSQQQQQQLMDEKFEKPQSFASVVSQKENQQQLQPPKQQQNIELLNKFYLKDNTNIVRLQSKSPILQEQKRKESIVSLVREDDSFEQQQGYKFLIKDMRKCLDKKQSKEEEESIIVDNFKIVPQFLNQQKQFQVPGTSERDTIGYKIEALRYYLEQQMGLDSFMKAYQTLENSQESEQLKQANQQLNLELRKYIPLIIQLIVCEDSYY